MQHDLDEAADVQAVGGQVEADIARHDASLEGGGQGFLVGALEHEAAGAGFEEEGAGGHYGLVRVDGAGLTPLCCTRKWRSIQNDRG